MQVQTLYVFGKDYPGELPWTLLAWCWEHEGVEFCIDGMLTDGKCKDAFAAFNTLASPHRLPSAERYDMHEGSLQRMNLWALNDGTERTLRAAFPRGYFE